MDLDQILELVNSQLLKNGLKPLNEAEITVLRGSLQGKNYDEIVQESEYSETYIKQTAGPKLFRNLSEALGKKITKTNVQEVLESVAIFPRQNKGVTKRVFWGDAPCALVFYGRDNELGKLKQWVVKDKAVCRLVAILGMPGMGKSLLASKLARDLQDDFELIIWRSLREDLLLEQLITDVMQAITDSLPSEIPEIQKLPENHSKEQLTQYKNQHLDYIQLLINYLREYRCLVILDDWEKIMKPGDFAGDYEAKHKPYGMLLQRLGEEEHQSCLVITSREKPREVAILEGENLPVRTLQLKGLGDAAKKILSSKQLKGENAWDELIRIYQGNPLALKLVASPIQELFAGDVKKFISQTSASGIIMSFPQLIANHLERLTEKETKIIYWLAIKPLGMDTLQLQELEEDDAFYEAIISLGWRSLIEKNDLGKFSLQPVVKERVTKQLVKLVTDELLNYLENPDPKNLNLLANYDLFSLDNTSTTVGDRTQSNQKEVYSLLSEKLSRKITAQEINLILQNKLPKRVKQNLTHLLAQFQQN